MLHVFNNLEPGHEETSTQRTWRGRGLRRCPHVDHEIFNYDIWHATWLCKCYHAAQITEMLPAERDAESSGMGEVAGVQRNTFVHPKVVGNICISFEQVYLVGIEQVVAFQAHTATHGATQVFVHS